MSSTATTPNAHTRSANMKLIKRNIPDNRRSNVVKKKNKLEGKEPIDQMMVAVKRERVERFEHKTKNNENYFNIKF